MQPAFADALCVCLGLRISEALALRWSDMDRLGARLSIKRGIVEQIVDDVKTEKSGRTFPLAGELLDRLKSWKQLTEFSGAEDWVFASPVKLGKLPYSYTGRVAGARSGKRRSGSGAFGYTHIQAYASHVAGCCGHPNSDATEDDAALRCPHHNEHLRDSFRRFDDYRGQQGSGACFLDQRSANRAQWDLTH